MGNFYLDIETTGLDPEQDKIITIQFQELDRYTGEAIGELIILKEWESSEKFILEQFIQKTKILDEYAFSFIPAGYNLNFEHNFLKRRAEIHGLPSLDVLDCPFIDLRAVGILMNHGQFKGSKLSDFTGKKGSGLQIPIWYANKEYQKIVDYIKDETAEFTKFMGWLFKEMPLLREKLKGDFSSGVILEEEKQ